MYYYLINEQLEHLSIIFVFKIIPKVLFLLVLKLKNMQGKINRLHMHRATRVCV